MRHYQFFPFSAEGRLLDGVAIDLDSDTGAIRRAIDKEFPNGCELWEGFRFVGRFHGAAARPAGLKPAQAQAQTQAQTHTQPQTQAQAQAQAVVH